MHADSCTGTWDSLPSSLFGEVVLKSKLYTLSFEMSPVLRNLPPAVHLLLGSADLCAGVPCIVDSSSLVCLTLQTMSPVCSPGFLGLASFPIVCFSDDMNYSQACQPLGLQARCLPLLPHPPSQPPRLQSTVLRNVQFSRVLGFLLPLALSRMPYPILLKTCLIKSSSFFKKPLRYLCFPLHFLLACNQIK